MRLMLSRTASATELGALYTQYVFALANGARSFYYNDWIRQPGVAIACCNDGLRPVFFKLEATDEEVGAPIDS